MKFGTKLIAAAALSLLPTVSYGQYNQPYSQPNLPPPPVSPDVAYCQALSALYVRYIGHDWQYGNYARWRANNDAQVAVAKCQQGDTAFAIPVLERELLNNKFTLPSRG